MGNFIDLTGKRFGKLTVIEIAGKDKRGQIRWRCICDCGNEKTINGGDLTRKNRPGTHSCGCENKSHKHGKKHTRLYRIYQGMKTRCYNTNDPGYLYYGAKGIQICNEWLEDFMRFYKWAITNGYSDDLSIDRINVNGNYEPSNCRWATKKEQNNNKSTNLNIEYNGKIQSVEEWSNETGLSKDSIYKRLSMGWSIEKTLTTPKLK